jgi:hypothetical protein
MAGHAASRLQIRLRERVLACRFCFSPVLLVAACPWPLAAVSRLAKRPATAGLALTRRTRPRSSSGEEDISEVFAAEPLLVGLRPGHRLTGQDSIQLAELEHDVLGRVRNSLFPGWALIQRQALEAAGVRPPTVDLKDTDLAAGRWLEQPGVDWIMLIPSLAAAHSATVIKPVRPVQLVPFTLQRPGSCTPRSPPAAGRPQTRAHNGPVCAQAAEPPMPTQANSRQGGCG